MSTQMSEEQIYEQAKKRINIRKGFFTHVTVYIIVNIILVLILASAVVGVITWYILPLVGWALGLFIHFIVFLVFERKANRAAIEKEVENIRRE